MEQLKAWVDWAKQNDAVILFDAAYECFVTEPGLPRSIFEVEGAKEVRHRGLLASPRSQASPAPAAAIPWCRTDLGRR